MGDASTYTCIRTIRQYHQYLEGKLCQLFPLTASVRFLGVVLSKISAEAAMEVGNSGRVPDGVHVLYTQLNSMRNTQ